MKDILVVDMKCWQEMLLEQVQLVENMLDTPLEQGQLVGYKLGMLLEQVQDRESGHELEMLGQQQQGTVEDSVTGNDRSGAYCYY